MYLLQLEQYIEHSGCDWLDKVSLVLSESKEKLQELSKLLIVESKEFLVESNKIRYNRELKLTNEEKRSAILELHKSYENIYKYQIFCELQKGENTLEIIEMKVI